MYRGLERGVAGIRYLVLRDRGKGCAVSHSFVHLSMTDKSVLILFVLLSPLLCTGQQDRSFILDCLIAGKPILSFFLLRFDFDLGLGMNFTTYNHIPKYDI